MIQLQYECCPRCGCELYFIPISEIFDSEGERFGFYLSCKACGWFSHDRFYSKEEVTMIKKSNGVKVEVLE